MAITYSFIASSSLTVATQYVTFSSIPSTYSDLVIRASHKCTTASYMDILFNATSSTLYNSASIIRNGQSVSFVRDNNLTLFERMTYAGGQGTNTFTNTEIYIPNYVSSIRKAVWAYSAPEDNQTDPGYLMASIGFFNDTSVISTIRLGNSAQNFEAGSNFWLYGIKRS